MTVLYFKHDPSFVVLITDTLSTIEEGKPHMFVNKSYLYPSIDMIMVVTGIKQVGLDWNHRLLERLSVLDIDNLDLFTTKELKDIWNELTRNSDIGKNTATVYHFGWSNQDNQFVRYVYRSTNNFESEKSTEGGVGIKPVPEDSSNFADMDPIELIKKVKSEQDALASDKRIFIGGELVFTMMGKDKEIIIKKIHRFDDYYDLWEEMNKYY